MPALKISYLDYQSWQSLIKYYCLNYSLKFIRDDLVHHAADRPAVAAAVYFL